MRALIGIGGSIKDQTWIRAEMAERGFDLVLAADSGADHILDLGLLPDIFIGDMDSVSEVTKQRLRALSIETHQFDVRKDGSDTELAIGEAIAKGAKEIVLFGSFSLARPDHLIANILLLEGLKRKYPEIRICLSDGLTLAQAIQGPVRQSFTFANLLDLPYVVSLLPISRELHGLSYEGLSYGLEQADLERGTSRSISNYATDRKAGFKITLDEGTAIVIMTPEE